ncbi:MULTISPECIES: hypothetical protein [Algoriphagus]|jgi:hypothetical protein|uniref:Uncharacterized protein n=2 Tax=Algoriphagus TaxID=246875 RepID=A0A327PN96_9BACT|nr:MULTISPECIES: hypothetical protein [Algoriphagus]RAI93785.1 hypothetical protein LV83_00691 [Algoriphagus yeomjeoni]SMP25633.1 hypothetical protein SAMN06265367_104195 [Algoriphagus winogradskyi]
MPIALDNLRVGRKYQLINMGEIRQLEIISRLRGTNFKVKDLDTLEFYTIEELLQWGIGKDYDIDEIYR